MSLVKSSTQALKGFIQLMFGDLSVFDFSEYNHLTNVLKEGDKLMSDSTIKALDNVLKNINN